MTTDEAISKLVEQGMRIWNLSARHDGSWEVWLYRPNGPRRLVSGYDAHQDCFSPRAYGATPADAIGTAMRLWGYPWEGQEGVSPAATSRFGEAAAELANALFALREQVQKAT